MNKEYQIEDKLIEQLIDLKYNYRPDIVNRKTLDESFKTMVSATSWTPFTIDISNYASADSAFIIIMAFYPSSSQTSGPKGNSVLQVDNFSFDNFITSISESTSKETEFIIYPNPSSDNITLTIDNISDGDRIWNIYNLVGTLVKSEKLKQNEQQINVVDLCSGIYIVEIKSN